MFTNITCSYADVQVLFVVCEFAVQCYRGAYFKLN